MRELMIGYRSLLEDKLRGEGLTLPQLRLLKAVRLQGDVSAAALARTCMVTPQTLQAVLGRAVLGRRCTGGRGRLGGRAAVGR